ncbi:MAG TPA: aldo/keto reductase [candidate division Zixibacteria bacterium]|nr:aldo/keto reductase [candidate division Zixibacteria bacterium]
MEYTTLGRTGLCVSVAGLGCGGPSRLGLRDSRESEAAAVALVRLAIDLGVNFLDTAQSYGTEPVVGKAIAGLPRERLVISTKKTVPARDHPDPGAELRRGLERSLRDLRTDYVDVYHLHGLEPRDYPFARERLLPVMSRLRDEGKIRFIGVTEAFVPDPSHAMLRESLPDDPWDVVMVGFNLLNPSARKTVLPLARKNKTGVLGMFAVRRALSRPERLRALREELLRRNAAAAAALEAAEPLGFVLRESGASTLPEAAYRFCRHEPGIDVVLTGTGNPDHLRDNIEALLKPPLPDGVLRRLEEMFGDIDWLTGN